MGKTGPRRDYTREDVLELLKARLRDDAREPWRTSEVADGLDCSQDTAFDRLEELEDEGTVRSKMMGAHTKAWWLAPEVEP